MIAKEAQRLRLDLPVLLPDAPDEADACVGRLVGELSGREGMERVHVVPSSGGEPAKLCIHYDPEVLSLARVRGIAEGAGARLTERFAHLLWEVGGLRHQRRARTVAERLRRLRGVVEAEASAAGALRIEFDREATSEQVLRRALDEMGVRVRGRESQGHDHGHGAEGHRHEAGHGDAGHPHGHAHGGVFDESTGSVRTRARGRPDW